LPPTATLPPATLTPAATVSSAKLSIAIVGVDKNRVITIQAQDFPANQTFKIRVGPFVGFFKNFVEVGTINSGSGGNFKFNVNLPDEVEDVDKITVRLDSSTSGVYAYNVFTNTTSGSIATTATPSTTTTPVAGAACQVSVSPSTSQTFRTREDFDAVWTVKNTSNRTWDASAVDYKYISGSEMQKFAKVFDLKQSVKSGESIKITVDMLTPDKAGSYTTTWSIVEGSTTLCSLPLTVVVK
ncbi:MAG: NBR1-Ig-like domain-containing protein, partial [Chloroflexota bacterium]